MPVYLIQCGDGVGPVKIGRAKDISARLREVQANCPYHLHMLRVLNGESALEADLHRRFHSLRIHFEWFEFSGEMLGDLGADDISADADISHRYRKTLNWGGGTVSEIVAGTGMPLPQEVLARARMVGLTQVDLSQLAGIAHTTFGRWLQGSNAPRSHLYGRLIAALEKAEAKFALSASAVQNSIEFA